MKRFIRQQKFLKKLEEKWRKPKGIHSKLRLQKKGHGLNPKIGYSKKIGIKNLIQDLKPVYITNISQINHVNQNNECIIISSTLGLKKKLELVKKANEKNLKIVNLDANKFIKEKEEQLKLKKDQQKNKEAEKKKTKKEAEKKAKEKEAEAKKEMTEEEKKLEEEKVKEEQRKILEQKV